MKRIPKISLILSVFLITLITDCEKDIVQEESLPEEEIVEAIIDPFYADLNEASSLEDYWNLFVADAIRSGKPDPGTGRNINIFFGTEPDFASGVTSDHAGRAYDICNQETVSFEIIKSFWEDYSVVQRLYTFYHEAGHARYKYRHPCESSECTAAPDDNPVMWLSVLPSNTPLEEFIRDKNNFFKRNWEGIRYFDCS